MSCNPAPTISSIRSMMGAQQTSVDRRDVLFIGEDCAVADNGGFALKSDQCSLGITEWLDAGTTLYLDSKL